MSNKILEPNNNSVPNSTACGRNADNKLRPSETRLGLTIVPVYSISHNQHLATLSARTASAIISS